MDFGPQGVRAAIEQATQQDAVSVRVGESRLKTWETNPGFYTFLQNIFMDQTAPLQARLGAAIYFKNGVDRYWRKLPKNSITAEEKDGIRQTIFNIDNSFPQILVPQVALAISRMARIDYPGQWIDLFDVLTSRVMAAAQEPQFWPALRVYLQISNQIIKALASSKLRSSRQHLYHVAPGLVDFFSGVYTTFFQEYMAKAPQDKGEYALTLLDLTRYLLKILVRLGLNGFEEPHRSAQASSLFQLLSSHVKLLVDGWMEVRTADSDILVKFGLHYGKYFMNLGEGSPVHFALMPDSLGTVMAYWSWALKVIDHQHTTTSQDDAEFSNFWIKLAIQGLRLMRLSIKVLPGNQPVAVNKPSDQDIQEQTQAAELYARMLFTKEKVEMFASEIVLKLFPMQQKQLEQWSEEPEQFVLDEQQDQWEYELRPCAQKLFMDLVQMFRDYLAQPLAHLVLSTEELSDLKSIIMADAYYTALGLGAHGLVDSIDFDRLLVERILPQSRLEMPYANIIRRRLLILTADWISVKCSVEARPSIYEMFLRLLKASEYTDFVVRLTAAEKLQPVVDEWQFEAVDFEPFMDDITRELIRMIHECSEIENRIQVLEVVRLIIERMDVKMAPYCTTIASLLPELWQQCGDQHLLQISILLTLTETIQSMRGQSAELHGLVIPLIRYALDTNQQSHVYLAEDAIDLWIGVLKNANSGSPDLLSIVPLAVSALIKGSEVAAKYLQVLELYAYLCPQELGYEFAGPICNAFAELVGSIKSDACQNLCRVISVFFWSIKQDDLQRGLPQTELVAKLVSAIVDEDEPNAVLVQYMHTMSWLALKDANLCLKLWNMTTPTPALLVGRMIELWVSKYESIAEIYNRKLTVLALASLVATREDSVLAHLPSIIKVWSAFVNDVNEDASGDSPIYWKTDSYSGEDHYTETPDSNRRTVYQVTSPIHTLSVKKCISSACSMLSTVQTGHIDEISREHLESLVK